MTVLTQGNPSLDKPSQRLALAGAGSLGPILKGFGGRIEIDIEADEILSDVRIFSFGENEFSKSLTGTFTRLGGGRLRWTTDIVYGVDTDFGRSGSDPVRNYLQWSLTKRGWVNPSGSPAGEGPRLANLTDDDLRKDRNFFSGRTYTEELSTSITSGSFNEASGMTFREDQKSVYVISDNLIIGVFDRDGVSLQDKITLPSGTGIFHDTEAIAYMGSDRFAVLDEGSLGSRVPAIVLFHLRAGATALGTEDVKRYELPEIEEFAGGNGAEGLAYDRVDDVFYVGTQPTGDGEGGLWRVDYKTKDTDGNPSQSLLFRWWDTLVVPGHLGESALLGDLQISRSAGAGIANNSIFCQFRTPDGGGPLSQRVVIQIDLDRLEYVGGLTHGLDGKFEGFCMDEASEDLYFVREGGGVNFFRYEHTTNEERKIFRRQFFVKDLPSKGSIYLNNQEAQLGEAIVFVNPLDGNRFSASATIGINILPVFSDEFFLQHEYSGTVGEVIGRAPTDTPGEFRQVVGKRRPNRWGQTLRSVGGAKTVEVFLNSTNNIPVIEERDIHDLKGLYWASPPMGTQRIIARLRADWGSSNYVDITGYLRFRQYQCPAAEV